MSLEKRLKKVEEHQRLHAPKQRPATVERTSDGEYFILSADTRTPIGDESAFQKWQAAGNRRAIILEGLTSEGSSLGSGFRTP